MYENSNLKLSIWGCRKFSYEKLLNKTIPDCMKSNENVHLFCFQFSKKIEQVIIHDCNRQAIGQLFWWINFSRTTKVLICEKYSSAWGVQKIAIVKNITIEMYILATCSIHWCIDARVLCESDGDFCNQRGQRCQQDQEKWFLYCGVQHRGSKKVNWRCQLEYRW